jgi:hypothetical protein
MSRRFMLSVYRVAGFYWYQFAWVFLTAAITGL